MLFSSCGPIFGAGADLLIANNCNTNKDSYSNLPHSYDGPNASYETLFGDYNFTITDYEVYTIAQTNSSGLNPNPTYSSSSNCLTNTSVNLTNTNGSSGGLQGSNTIMNSNNMGNNNVSLAKAKYERY